MADPEESRHEHRCLIEHGKRHQRKLEDDEQRVCKPANVTKPVQYVVSLPVYLIGGRINVYLNATELVLAVWILDEVVHPEAGELGLLEHIEEVLRVRLAPLHQLSFILHLLHLQIVRLPAWRAWVELLVHQERLFHYFRIAVLQWVKSFLIVQYGHLQRRAEVFKLLLRVRFTVVRNRVAKVAHLRVHIVARRDDDLQSLVVHVVRVTIRLQVLSVLLVVPVDADEASIWVLLDQLEFTFLGAIDWKEGVVVCLGALVMRQYLLEGVAI